MKLKTLIIVLSLALASVSVAAVAAVAAAASEAVSDSTPTLQHGLGLLLDTEKSPVGSIYSQGVVAT